MSTSATRNPYEYIHFNKHLQFTPPRGYFGNGKPAPVTVNFTSTFDTSDGKTILKGKSVDEYGWWHTGVTMAIDAIPDDAERVGYPNPEDAPFPVTVGFDWRHGLLRLQIPDDVALRLNKWRKAHWHEFVGMGDGYSDAPKRGTWEHRALAYLHSVQCHTTDDMPFIQGVSMEGLRDGHGHLPADAYDLLVSTSGVRFGAWPTVGFHFSG